MACMKCEERIIETNTAVIKCFLCDKMLHHRCIHDAGILTTRWSSKSKPPASLLEVLGSRYFTFRCPACIINLTSTNLTLPNLNINVPTNTTNTQTTEHNFNNNVPTNTTNITPNTTELDLQINTILTTLKSHTIQIQSLMTQHRPLTNIPLNNTTKYNNDLPPMTYIPRLNTNNYNNNFPSNTHTPRLNSNNYNIDFPPMTHTIRNNNTYYPNYITHTPRLNTNNYSNDLPHQFHNIKNNNTYHPNHKLTLHNKSNPSPSYNNSNLTAIIENITKTNLNRTYINKLLTDLKIDKNTVSLVSFGNTSCFITFTTHFSKYNFINLNSKLNYTDYKKLFIHNLLTHKQIHVKNIYFHA